MTLKSSKVRVSRFIDRRVLATFRVIRHLTIAPTSSSRRSSSSHYLAEPVSRSELVNLHAFELSIGQKSDYRSSNFEEKVEAEEEHEEGRHAPSFQGF